MAILPIITLPDPLLRKISEPVDRVDAEVRRLLDDMLETMYEAPGVGLAAIQVAVAKRIVVVDTGKTEETRSPLFLINPEIIWASEELSVYQEGCLSVPDYFEDVKRPARVRVRHLDRDSASSGIRRRRPARDRGAARAGSPRRRALHRPSVALKARARASRSSTRRRAMTRSPPSIAPPRSVSRNKPEPDDCATECASSSWARRTSQPICSRKSSLAAMRSRRFTRSRRGRRGRGMAERKSAVQPLGGEPRSSRSLAEKPEERRRAGGLRRA